MVSAHATFFLFYPFAFPGEIIAAMILSSNW